MLCLSVDQIQLDRAKQSTKSAILMNLESRVRNLFPTSDELYSFFSMDTSFLHQLCLQLGHVLQMIASEDIGRQVMTYGER